MTNRDSWLALVGIGWLLSVLLSGCSGSVTMPESARAGDTIVLAAGWKHSFNRNSVTVTITDAGGSVTTYSPGDPAIRAVVNLYPDPNSFMRVGTGSGLTDPNRYNDGGNYGTQTNYNITKFDPDWWLSTVYIDLPTTLATGQASVSVASPTESYGPVSVNIIPGSGSPTTFAYDVDGTSITAEPMSPQQIQALERAPVWVVAFSGGTSLPEAIQVDLTHDPDSTIGGAGKARVVNPTGDIKNLSWTDDGQNLRVLVYSNGDGTDKDPNKSNYGLKLYKFYVDGEVTNLVVNNVAAFDADGNPVAGVAASVSAE